MLRISQPRGTDRTKQLSELRLQSVHDDRLGTLGFEKSARGMTYSRNVNSSRLPDSIQKSHV